MEKVKIQTESKLKDDTKETPDTAAALLKLFAYILLQGGALAAGIFTILAWISSQDAKAQANAANMLSFVALCGNTPSRPYISSLCAVASPSAHSVLNDLASITTSPFAPPTSTSVSVSTTPSTASSSAAAGSSGSFSRSSSASVSTGLVTSTRTQSTATLSAILPLLTAPGAGYGAEAGSTQLTTAAKIGVDAGVGIGIPTLVVAVAGVWLIRRKRLCGCG